MAAKPMTKTQILNSLAESTNLKKQDIHKDHMTNSMYSTFNKVPTDIEQFQKFGKFPPKIIPNFVEQKKLLDEFSIEKEDIPRLIDDPRLLHLAKIKMKQRGMKEDEATKQK